MVVEYIRYTVENEARQKELIAAYVEAAKSLDLASECLSYELTVCEEDASSLVLRIEWESTKAHMEGFRKGSNFGPFFKAIGGFVKEITEMRHYGLTAVRGK